MSGRTDRFVVAEQIAHDRIDGEVVAIELATGTYFSLVGVAADVWEALALGTDSATIAAAVAARFPDEPSVDAQVDALLQQLTSAGLVTVASDAGGAPAVPEITAERFTPLQAEAFTDMQDLMLLDPVHDIDATVGWPSIDPSTDGR